jgi:acyl-CoA dehydrogenase
MSRFESLLASLEEASRSQLLAGAIMADKLNQCSLDNLALVRSLGLMGAAVPNDRGGLGLEIEQLASIASVIGKGCLSTALIWSMHTQQVNVLAHSRSRCAAHALEQVVEQGRLVASVTSEAGKGGDIFRALAPIGAQAEGRVSVARTAPTVSYGLQSHYYLVTMRADEHAPETDVRFVLVSREDGDIESTGEWNAMGVRGTQSIPMAFNAVVNVEHVLPENFRSVALRHFVPCGQILWVASWLGAAQGLFERMLEQVAENKHVLSVKLKSDLYVSRVAELKTRLLAIEGFIGHTVALYKKCLSDSIDGVDADLIVRVNALKVYVSEQVVVIVDNILELSGLARGYCVEPSLGVERLYRDLLSAKLMYSNDSLRRSIGIHAIKAFVNNH